MYYLGVDGGGTKTAFLIIDEEANLLSYLTTETCHYMQIGMDNFQKVIAEGIKKSCSRAEITVEQIAYAFFGIPGYGENEKDSKIIEEKLAAVIPREKFKAGNDVEAGWAGSLACQPGINIVAGTGAIGFAKDQSGKIGRASGWGYFCGDEGSAYWLGKKVISLFSKEADGRVAKTAIYQIVKDHFELKRDFDLIEVLYDDLELKRNKIAKLALLLYQAAEAGDKKAAAAYREAAYEHSLTVKSLISKLDFKKDEKISISYSGGVFKAGSYILKPLQEFLAETEVELIEPILKPITGAALYALLLKNETKKAAEVIEKLKKAEKRAGI